jgi:hypothetical protein
VNIRSQKHIMSGANRDEVFGTPRRETSADRIVFIPLKGYGDSSGNSGFLDVHNFEQEQRSAYSPGKTIPRMLGAGRSLRETGIC